MQLSENGSCRSVFVFCFLLLDRPHQACYCTVRTVPVRLFSCGKTKELKRKTRRPAPSQRPRKVRSRRLFQYVRVLSTSAPWLPSARRTPLPFLGVPRTPLLISRPLEILKLFLHCCLLRHKFCTWRHIATHCDTLLHFIIFRS